jgi:hypothetical protein
MSEIKESIEDAIDKIKKKTQKSHKIEMNKRQKPQQTIHRTGLRLIRFDWSIV